MSLAHAIDLQHHDDTPVEDHIVRLGGSAWRDFERLLAIRGEKANPRLTYLDGALEIMSPSRTHETLKSLISRLVEAYCLEAGIRFMPVGAWTLKDRLQEVGLEPDECYIFDAEETDRPHLAIEVVWTSGGIDKLEVYRRLRVQEVWYWRKGRIQVYVLADDGYRPQAHSARLPGLDLDLLTKFLDQPTAYDAIQGFRAHLDKQLRSLP
ncbi:MAG: Uma2 family endonuclease [Halochromatium sp.]|nr:Uma2 family endonuclease [Halochromatium sp.]